MAGTKRASKQSAAAPAANRKTEPENLMGKSPPPVRGRKGVVLPKRLKTKAPKKGPTAPPNALIRRPSMKKMLKICPVLAPRLLNRAISPDCCSITMFAIVTR